MAANDRQIGGDHYRKVSGEQHWDRVVRLNLNYFQAMITRYVERYRDKNGIQDLEKALHFLEKLIEVEKTREAGTLKDIEEEGPRLPEGTILCKHCEGDGCAVCYGQGTISTGDE